MQKKEGKKRGPYKKRSAKVAKKSASSAKAESVAATASEDTVAQTLDAEADLPEIEYKPDMASLPKHTVTKWGASGGLFRVAFTDEYGIETGFVFTEKPTDADIARSYQTFLRGKDVDQENKNEQQKIRQELEMRRG